MINEKIIQKLTHPVSFERGLKYYQQGRVTKYSNLGNRLSAEVIGTGVYTVNIDLSNLEVSCNCPAAERQDFCKHQIAVLLTYAKGEVKAKSTPKIKASQDNRPKSETRISELLVNMTKEEILLHLDKLSIREPVIQTYFTKVVSAIGSFDYKNFRKYIRSKINYFNSTRRIYDYHAKLSAVCIEIEDKLEEMPVGKESSEFLLEEGYWITEKLAYIDDSDGMAGSLINMMISKAVIYLNNAPVSDLELFYSYMGKKSSFEFHLELLFRLLSHVTNREILDSLETRMEKTINRKDPLFAFSRESGLSIYLEYLFEMKPVKFEELALEFIDSISGVKMKYAEHLFLNKRCAEVIDLLKKEIPHHLYNAIYEGSLLVLKRYDELIQFYSDCNSRLFSLSLFKKAVQLARHHVPEILGKLITEALANKIKTFEETIELYLFLDKGDEAVRIMEQLTEEQFQYFRDYIDKLTAKLMIINPAVAVKFAETLVNKEFAVVNRTNYYDRLIDYIHNLEMLEDRDFLDELYNRIKTQYKTKKKLLERLNLTAPPIEEPEIDFISRNSNIKGPELKLIKFKK